MKFNPFNLNSVLKAAKAHSRQYGLKRAIVYEVDNLCGMGKGYGTCGAHAQENNLRIVAEFRNGSRVR